MNDRPYVILDRHVYYQQREETRDEWVARTQRIVSGEEEMAGYLCDTLTGCSVPGGTIEVCTPCQAQPPSQQCKDNHQADLDAFCEEFDCDQCR